MLRTDSYLMNKKSGFNNNFHEKKEFKLETYVYFSTIWHSPINDVMYLTSMNIRFLRSTGHQDQH